MIDLDTKLQEAETKAWEALAKYKFIMFGYWAAIWVHLNQLRETKSPNPFSTLVHFAKGKIAK